MQCKTFVYQPYTSSASNNSDEIRISVENQDLCFLSSKSYLQIHGREGINRYKLLFRCSRTTGDDSWISWRLSQNRCQRQTWVNFDTFEEPHERCNLNTITKSWQKPRTHIRSFQNYSQQCELKSPGPCSFRSIQNPIVEFCWQRQADFYEMPYVGE